MPNLPTAVTTTDTITTSDSHASTDIHVILALDYGVKKMGMALGNSLTQDARPFDILAMNNGQPDWDNLIGIISIWQVSQVLVGLPLHMDGTASMLSKRAHKFARRLAHRLAAAGQPVTVKLVDERLSSREARTLAWDNGWIKHAQDNIDHVAAAVLLASHFEHPDAAHIVNSPIVNSP